MAGYRLSPRAEKDLEDIWLYTFKQWSISQADNYYNEIIIAIEGLVSGRAKGRKIEFRKGYLKFPVGRHLIFFRHLEVGIEIIRILHQSMDFNRHL